MTRVGHQFAFRRRSFELCYLAKLEVECEVLVFVLDSQDHVSSLVAGALPEVEQLLADLDIGINCTGHHLDL